MPSLIQTRIIYYYLFKQARYQSALKKIQQLEESAEKNNLRMRVYEEDNQRLQKIVLELTEINIKLQHKTIEGVNIVTGK